jgi:hypothetical protein
MLQLYDTFEVINLTEILTGVTFEDQVKNAIDFFIHNNLSYSTKGNSNILKTIMPTESEMKLIRKCLNLSEIG